MAVRFVIVGGGPAGNTAATVAARLGAEVTLIERDVVGGAAHLWDCIPSKAMIATAGAKSFIDRSEGMGLDDTAVGIDIAALKTRITDIEARLEANVVRLLESQSVRMLRGTARLSGPHELVVATETGEIDVEADAVLISTGSRPRIPD